MPERPWAGCTAVSKFDSDGFEEMRVRLRRIKETVETGNAWSQMTHIYRHLERLAKECSYGYT